MGTLLDRLKARIVGRQPAAGQADGKTAEGTAARYLDRQGVRLIERNFSVRGGEIDLIGHHGGAIVFVEVRMRQRSDFGGAGASITPAKRRRIILAARHWLTAHPAEARRPCRFDALLMTHPEDDAPDWLQNAFDANGRV